MYSPTATYDGTRRGGTSLDGGWPQTWEEWCLTYDRREDYYRGLGYRVEEIKEMGLFRALDNDGKVLAVTRQLTLDIQHVVNTDANALAAGWALEAQEGAEAELQDGLDVWRRSSLDSRRIALTNDMAQMGRAGVEAYLDSNGDARLRVIDPRHYRVEYDPEDGVTPLRAYITFQYDDEVTLSPTGEPENTGVKHTYVRELTDTTSTTWIDGEEDEEASGEHGLGVVPFVNLLFQPAGDADGNAEHGLWAAQGLVSPLAAFDSLFNQISAVGNRVGNPIPFIAGGIMDDGTKVGHLGRWINGLPVEGRVGYMEAHLTGLQVLLEAAMKLLEQARTSCPEFLFAGAGANASGEALTWLATAFELKVGTIRERMFADIARITDIAVRFERNEQYRPDEDLFTVTGPPLLPVDKEKALKGLKEAKGLGLQQEDVIRHLQRLGYVPPDADAKAYANEAADREADRATMFFNNQQAAAATDEDGG